MATVTFSPLAVNDLVAQAPSGGEGIVVVFFLLVAVVSLIAGVIRHIGALWEMALQFLRPMLRAIQMLAAITTVLILVFIGLMHSGDTRTASPPPVASSPFGT
jgi:hypothetical protein